MQLTQKEISLLKDLKDDELLCAEKYARHAAAAADPKLKNLFSSISEKERQHYNALVQLETGTPPAPSSLSGGGQASGNAGSQSSGNQNQSPEDKYLCTDLLYAEKFASSLYDTCIFEFSDESARTLLNTIQKEEQHHGKAIYDYMNANGMYS